MIDVHIILLGNENPEWLAQCIQSLRTEPVAVHLVDGEWGHIGRGRAEGFSRGFYPYVAYVDPDDYVLPGMYARCARVLDADPALDLVYMQDGRALADGTVEAFENDLHHACVYRRTFVETRLGAMRQDPLNPERRLEPAAKNTLRLSGVGYAYRDYEGSAYKTMRDELYSPKGTFQTFEEFHHGA